jgi:hypothetical protein
LFGRGSVESGMVFADQGNVAECQAHGQITSLK